MRHIAVESCVFQLKGGSVVLVGRGNCSGVFGQRGFYCVVTSIRQLCNFLVVNSVAVGAVCGVPNSREVNVQAWRLREAVGQAVVCQRVTLRLCRHCDDDPGNAESRAFKFR